MLIVRQALDMTGIQCPSMTNMSTKIAQEMFANDMNDPIDSTAVCYVHVQELVGNI